MTEVGYEGPAVCGKEDVARFEVAVENPVLVGIMDGAADIGHDSSGPCKGSGRLAKVLAEGAAGHILHGEPWQTIAFAGLVDGDDARVGEAGGGLCLQPEPLEFLGPCESST
jgi:hypothetical protein